MLDIDNTPETVPSDDITPAVTKLLFEDLDWSAADLLVQTSALNEDGGGSFMLVAAGLAKEYFEAPDADAAHKRANNALCGRDYLTITEDAGCEPRIIRRTQRIAEGRLEAFREQQAQERAKRKAQRASRQKSYATAKAKRERKGEDNRYVIFPADLNIHGLRRIAKSRGMRTAKTALRADLVKFVTNTRPSVGTFKG